MGEVIMVVEIKENQYFEMENGYFKMPNFFYEACYEMGLTRVERDIYACLIRYQNGSNRNPFPSYKTLKKYTLISKNTTIAEGIRGLEEKGLITVISRGSTQGQSNVYKINYLYPVKEEPTEATGGPIRKSNTTTQKTQQKEIKESTGIIPFRRGVHESIITTTEAEKNLKGFAGVGEDDATISRLGEILGF